MKTRTLLAAVLAPVALAGAGVGVATSQAHAENPDDRAEDYYSVETTGEIEVLEGDDHSVVMVPAKVCVLRDNPTSENGWSRISLDPWQLPIEDNDGKPIKAWEGIEGSPGEGDFPESGSYRVGECAEGDIPFRVSKTTTTDGNRIVWDSGLGQTEEFTFEL